MLYLFDRMEAFTDQGYAKILTALPHWRQEKAKRYRHVEDRKRSALVYLLLARGLWLEYGLDAPMEFSYSLHGKPGLKNRPDIHFSMTHCALGAACLIDRRPCGVDMQETVPISDEVAARYCSTSELAELVGSPSRDAALCRLWAAKESAWKQLGTGLPAQPHRAERPTDVQLFFYQESADYHLCCAVPEGVDRPKLVRVKEHDIGI